MIDGVSEVSLAARRLSIHVDWRAIIRAAGCNAWLSIGWLYAALHRSTWRDGRVLGGLDVLPDAVLRDLKIERSPIRRMADQEARLRADALLST
jgi:hypothetical protein